MIITETKPFDEKLFNDNDAKGRQAAKKIFTNAGFILIPSANIYAVDCMLFGNGKQIGYVEVAIRHNWTGRDFPYNNVYVPYRKLKYTNLDKPTYFIMFNTDCSAYMIIKSDDIRTSDIVTVSNKYVDHETTFRVNLDKVSFNNLSLVEAV